ncbi:MAG: protein kinase [Nannocystaceae bacterium]
MPTLVGSKLDKYEIQAEVGHGGMAVVYRGMDTVLRREVAIKVLHPHLADREESRARLRREALTVAKLRHENILEIFDYAGEDSKESYLVTEFIHGMTLRQWLDERWRPHPALAALIIHRLCVALTHAHKSDVVHRDIKPENVMIREDGCLKLMDFGIAQIIDHQKLTMTGQLLGSPAYMAPELISGRPLDARTDLFSVGIMLYQLAAGMLPFSGRNPHEVLSRIADAEYPRPSTICPLVDDELEAIIDKALAREPDDRFQSADSFARELEGYLGEAGIPATQAEVMAYFHDPEGYSASLNERVCAALMERADAAIKQGFTARAIRLLGRVLELDPHNKAATALLGRLRTRERRIRTLTMIAAGLAGIGLVAAGVLLALWTPDEPTTMPVDESIGANPKTSRPKLIVPSAPRATTVSGATGEETAPTTSDGDPRGTGESGGTGTKKGGTRPTKTPPPTIRDASCRLAISGIPPAGVSSYKLTVGKEISQLTSLDPSISFSGDRTSVSINGPRYYGHLIVTRDACHPGATLPLVANRQKATLRFTHTPPNTTAECVSGPCPDTKPHLISDGGSFPPIAVADDQVVIELLFKSSGYKPKTDRRAVQPGPNDWQVDLKPHGE